MPFRKSKGLSRNTWIGITLGSLALLFLIAFWHEIMLVLARVITVLLALLAQELPEITLDMRRAINVVVFFNLIGGFFLMFQAWLLLTSAQALLPVAGFRDVARTAFHLVLYIFRRHGAAVFIKDGEIKATSEELRRSGRGVVVVDFNSAVVLEETVPTPSVMRVFENLADSVLVALGLADPYQNPRTMGTGIVFTRPRERIRAAVDLRSQFRLRPQNLSYSRDGIELRANVWTKFTIGQEPEVLQVTYLGDMRAENLRVVGLQAVDETHVRVASVGRADELDDADRAEIHHQTWVDLRRGQMSAYAPLPSTSLLPVFNAQRVFAAVFSEARNAQEEVIPWDELPTLVATDLYRRVVMETNYDEFYDIRTPDHFPLDDIKRKLRMQMRNNGILAYRLVLRAGGQPLLKADEKGEWVRGEVFSVFDLQTSAVRSLTAPKVLRDRGIKVIASGFGDLMPVSEGVYQQRLDHLLARWDRDTELIHARNELDALRIRGRARRQAQEELNVVLARILETREHTQEIMALRVFQAIDGMAADPKTRRFLPAETLDMINKLQSWLLPPQLPKA
ncbi:hypothetical protein [Levilinea saccharolytica]|uniref:Band 7 domain-containing protein n=1 Tax=Levilinea saccharolytica TaxID=229921 RepID=A0A0M9U2X4_9CHLR|nr:hypothetical protein [Levilinea saccharolytica]KPL91528.1 hypothetical protein ADN01_00955 [Levilinea saccharolytica]GAP19153.1 hypothetical protein LSAC_03052 [Levilinea saccharolytica]